MGKHPDSVVKCACGRVFRLKDWTAHQNTCRRGATSVTSQDIDTMLRLENEAKKREPKPTV